MEDEEHFEVTFDRFQGLGHKAQTARNMSNVTSKCSEDDGVQFLGVLYNYDYVIQCYLGIKYGRGRVSVC